MPATMALMMSMELATKHGAEGGAADGDDLRRLDEDGEMAVLHEEAADDGAEDDDDSDDGEH